MFSLHSHRQVYYTRVFFFYFFNMICENCTSVKCHFLCRNCKLIWASFQIFESFIFFFPRNSPLPIFLLGCCSLIYWFVVVISVSGKLCYNWFQLKVFQLCFLVVLAMPIIYVIFFNVLMSVFTGFWTLCHTRLSPTPRLSRNKSVLCYFYTLIFCILGGDHLKLTSVWGMDPNAFSPLSGHPALFTK